jgi:septal ring factor EnvC (AmiA/AmiB activator)
MVHRGRRAGNTTCIVQSIDIFVLISGCFSILATVPLIYLAIRSLRDARKLRLIQYELAHLMRETKEVGEEVRELQHEIRSEQHEAKSEIDETRRTVEHVTGAVEQVTEAMGQVTEAVEQATDEVAKQRRPLIRRILAVGTRAG